MASQQLIEKTIKKYLSTEQYIESRTVLEILTSKRFCHKKPDSGLMKILSKRLEERIKKNEPVILNILHGPRKNPNATSINYAEWAELFTLHQLARLYYRIKSVYKPSLKIRIFCDDARAIAVNNYDPKSTEEYIQSLRELIRILRLEGVIEVIQFNKIYNQYNVADYLSDAEERIRKWELDKRNKERIVEMDEHCRKNIILPSTSSQEIKNKIKNSSHLFRVYFEAETLAGIYDIPDIWATYRKEHGFLLIYSLTKGNITQPWQGEGCLRLLPCGKIIPYVLTQARKEKLKIKEFEVSFPELPSYFKLIKLAR